MKRSALIFTSLTLLVSASAMASRPDTKRLSTSQLTEEYVRVPNLTVQGSSSRANCGEEFGCTLVDGKYYPNVNVPRSEAAKYSKPQVAQSLGGATAGSEKAVKRDASNNGRFAGPGERERYEEEQRQAKVAQAKANEEVRLRALSQKRAAEALANQKRAAQSSRFRPMPKGDEVAAEKPVVTRSVTVGSQKKMDQPVVASEKAVDPKAKNVEQPPVVTKSDTVVDGAKPIYRSQEEISEQARLKALEADRIKNMEAAISQKAGVNKEYAATLRTQLEKDPKTFGYKTKDEYEARLKDPEFTQKKEVADATAAAQAKAYGVDHEFTVKRQKAWEKFQAEEKDKEIAQKINDQVPAPDYKKAATDARMVEFDIKQQQLDSDKAVARAQMAVDNAGTVEDKVQANKQLTEAKKSQDVAYGRTGEPVKKDEPEVAVVDPKKDPVAVPGNDAVAKSDDPCSNPKMSHRQAEDCSMKKLEEAKVDADKNVARCFYSGFAANNNAATNKCSAVKSTADAKRLGISLKGVKDTDCGSGMVMCNPLVFGIQQDKSAICVGNTKEASKDCATKANLKSPEAQARYKELMKENENKQKLAELEKKLKRSCSDEEMKIDRAFTQNIKIRNDKEDHQKTCEVLGKAIVNAKDVTKDVAATPSSATKMRDPNILPSGGFVKGVE